MITPIAPVQAPEKRNKLLDYLGLALDVGKTAASLGGAFGGTPAAGGLGISPNIQPLMGPASPERGLALYKIMMGKK